MLTYLILNPSTASRRQLAHYLQRTGWLTISQTGAFTEEILAHLESGSYGLVFLRLADPADEVPSQFLEVLRNHPALIITSPYPQHLFSHLRLAPFDFLTEPYSFERFAECIDKLTSLYG